MILSSTFLCANEEVPALNKPGQAKPFLLLSTNACKYSKKDQTGLSEQLHIQS